jgi:hypothetical protein
MSPRVALLWIALLLAGCGTTTASRGGPLGRPITAATVSSSSVAAAPAPQGDPPAERGGTIPPRALAAENKISPRLAAGSPQQALRDYALLYTNWHARQLPARARELAARSTGQARLTAQQLAALPNQPSLARNQVANSGEVVALAPGQGPDAGMWVIVTRERTTGTGAYAGLPAGVHVTLARVRAVGHRWVVSSWKPTS